MDIVILIERYGPWVGLIVFAVVQTLFMLRTANKARSKAEEAKAAAQEASTARDNAFTAQFNVFSSENRRLQARVDTLETAMAAQTMQGAAQEKELKTAQERAGRLEIEVKTLTEKVAVLETEKAQRAGELERERRQGEIQQRELASAKVEIAGLQQRVSHLEGENAALKLMLEKIQVVKVEPEPDPPPPTPPTSRVIPLAEPGKPAEEKIA